MKKILKKALTLITVVLAMSTARTFAQSSVRFTNSMQVITSSCVNCHSNFPVNNEQAWAQNGAVVPGKTLVIPGDPANSLLWQRLHGIGGIIMPPPPVGELPQSQLDTISNWIANF